MENHKWIVSILMPVYNGEKTIQLALKSLLNQSYTNWVCIIVNDGSTDGTKAILDSLTDSRFRVIHLQKNMGRGAARQVALDNAIGDYIAYLDADDFYHESKIFKQIEELSNNDKLALVSCACGSYDKNRNLISVRGDKSVKPIIHSYGEKLLFIPASVMLKCNLAKEVKYKQYNVGEDMDYFNRLLVDCQYKTIPEILYYYSEYESSTYPKLLKYSFENYLNSYKQQLNKFTYYLKNIIKAHIILAYYIVVPLFLGTSYIIRMRGRNATDKEKNDFKNTLLYL